MREAFDSVHAGGPEGVTPVLSPVVAQDTAVPAAALATASAPDFAPNARASHATIAKPFRIGGVTIASPFVLAPLAGVSDSPFRRLAREQGASAVYTEMVSSEGLVRGSQATFDYCEFQPSERPIGIQLFGSDPATMADAARVLSDLPPERRPDLIDINRVANKRDLDFRVNTRTCSISGFAQGYSCRRTITRAGDEKKQAEISFKVDVRR